MMAQVDITQRNYNKIKDTRNSLVTKIVKGEGKHPRGDRYNKILSICQKEEENAYDAKWESSLDSKFKYLTSKYSDEG